jgi:hypothetical protein
MQAGCSTSQLVEKLYAFAKGLPNRRVAGKQSAQPAVE